MLPNLTCVMIYSLAEWSVLEHVLTTPSLWALCNICRKISMMEFNVKEVAVCRAAIFSNEVLHQIYFLGIYQIFNTNNSLNLNYQMWFKQRISLNNSNFDMENYYSLVDVKKKSKVSTTNLTKNV